MVAEPPEYQQWLPDDRGKKPPPRWIVAIQASIRRAIIRVLTQVGRIPPLRSLSERMMSAMFDNLAPQWDAIRADPVYHEALVAAFAHTPRALGPQAPFAIPGWPGNILDVACGTGKAAAWLRQRYPRAALHGVDISPQMVQRANFAVPGLTAVVASGADLPFENGSYELIVSLDGVFDTTELARICSPRGAIVLIYSKGGRCPVARNVEAIAAELTRAGMVAVAHRDSWWGVFAMWPQGQISS